MGFPREAKRAYHHAALELLQVHRNPLVSGHPSRWTWKSLAEVLAIGRSIPFDSPLTNLSRATVSRYLDPNSTTGMISEDVVTDLINGLRNSVPFVSGHEVQERVDSAVADLERLVDPLFVSELAEKLRLRVKLGAGDLPALGELAWDPGRDQGPFKYDWLEKERAKNALLAIWYNIFGHDEYLPWLLRALQKPWTPLESILAQCEEALTVSREAFETVDRGLAFNAEKLKAFHPSLDLHLRLSLYLKVPRPFYADDLQADEWLCRIVRTGDKGEAPNEGKYSGNRDAALGIIGIGFRARLFSDDGHAPAARRHFEREGQSGNPAAQDQKIEVPC